MTSFLSFHAAAVSRGDGLRPELLALVTGMAPHSDQVPRHDGMIQSGPDPKPRIVDEAAVSPIMQALHAHSGT